MTRRLRLRRGTTAQHARFTGLDGEVTIDTDKGTIVVHDGVTVGGQPLALEGAGGGAGVSDGDKGDVVVSSSGTVWAVPDLATKASTSHTHSESDVTGLVADLAAKAPLASPTFTGTPAAPTAAGGTNTTQIATTAFVAAGFQPLDADLTALAASASTAGLVERTGAATYTTRLIGVANSTDVLTRADGDSRYALSGSSGGVDELLAAAVML